MNNTDLHLLQNGKPPESDEILEYLTLSNIWLKNMREYCLQKVVANGGCKVKIIHGDHFTGKTHYVNYLRINAQKDGFFVVLLDISSIGYVELNLKMIELAPKGTGKSYVFNNLSKYNWTVSGWIVTRAGLFYNIATKMPGIIHHYDFLALDEV